MEVKLNEGQSSFITGAFDWFHLQNRYSILEAPAGYGKSFCLKYLLEKLGRRAKPLILAETNEAVNVLRTFLGGNYTTTTVCSALNLVIDKSGEGKLLVQHSEPDLSNYNLLVIDEASQLSSERLGLITSLAEKYKLYVLFIGHRSQLPPVEKDLGRFDKCISPVFLEESYRKFKLTEPVRNSGEIWEFCNVLEERIYSIGATPYKFKIDYKFIEDYLATEKGELETLTGQTTILCYTNKRAVELNDIVRNCIFGEERAKDRFVLHDRVLYREPIYGFKSPLVTKTTSLPALLGKGTTKVSFNVNTKGVVERVGSRTVLGIDCWELYVKTNHPDIKDAIAYFYTPADMEEFNAYQNKLYWRAMYEHNVALRVKKWKEYHDSRLLFGNIRHGYTQTIHTAQGSTLPNVILDKKDIGKCQNKILAQKLFYVGASRARDNLYILY